MRFLHVRKGGEHFRVADPAWEDPLDGSYSKTKGGRWNSLGSFPVVYLNASLSVARANVLRQFEGLPWGPEDLNPSKAPILVVCRVPEADFVDLVSSDGCRSVGLPDTYPLDENGDIIPQERCHPIGKEAWDSGAAGIAYRSAALKRNHNDDELVWFERENRLNLMKTIQFDDWYWIDNEI